MDVANRLSVNRCVCVCVHVCVCTPVCARVCVYTCVCTCVSGHGVISSLGRCSRVQLLSPEVCHDTQRGLQCKIHQQREHCSEMETYGMLLYEPPQQPLIDTKKQHTGCLITLFKSSEMVPLKDQLFVLTQ